MLATLGGPCKATVFAILAGFQNFGANIGAWKKASRTFGEAHDFKQVQKMC